MLDIRPTSPRAPSRARRLARLRARAATGAAAVFVAAWLALYVPAAREDTSTGTTTAAQSVEDAADVSAIGGTPATAQDDSSFVEQSAPLTSGQS